MRATTRRHPLVRQRQVLVSCAETTVPAEEPVLRMPLQGRPTRRASVSSWETPSTRSLTWTPIWARISIPTKAAPRVLLKRDESRRQQQRGWKAG